MASTLVHLLILFGGFGQLWSFSPRYTPFNTVQGRHKSQLGAGSSAREESGIISVSIQKRFPDATPEQARDAWMDYHWKKGGGLPILIVSSDESPKERTILPTLMKEQLLDDEVEENQEDQSHVEISYKVTDAGPLFPGIIPDTHSANVTFEYTNQATVMNWDVSFETTKFYTLYEAVTQWTVGTSATTVQECLTLPRRLNVKTVIDGDIDPFLARKECLEFVWASGGGLPLIPPIPFGDILEEGGGSARRSLLRIPPLITESIVDTATTEKQTSFEYRLNRPGLTTFPFLLHTHIGHVSFTSTATGLAIDWEVEIRPYQIAKPIVEKLVEMTVSTLVRNLRVKLLEPDAVVLIKPPRGNANLTMGLEEFGKVSKSSWLGGVLESHLSDVRSTKDQTLSLIQPWTWGRSGEGDELDIVQYQWIDGQSVEEDV
mmetsp:Transcript_14339/g.24382  ORF Transcript_14339/g.24382 Transcript_14339/m.24382 type:complete len:432 (-) Transcript_14339:56-1351(-)